MSTTQQNVTPGQQKLFDKLVVLYVGDYMNNDDWFSLFKFRHEVRELDTTQVVVFLNYARKRVIMRHYLELEHETLAVRKGATLAQPQHIPQV
jgi:hypothetical protein